MKTFHIASAAAVLATASLALYAASPAMAQKADAERDRTVTWEQAKAQADARWARLDVNKDGKIDEADRKAARENRMEERFAAMDTDRNGAISKAEFLAHHEGRAEGWKGHGEGRMMGHGQMGHDMMGPGKMARGRMGGHRGGNAMLAMADANKDGAITRAEYDAGVKKHFDMADANKDGKVTPEERRAAMRTMMEKMGAARPAPAAN